MPTTFDFLVYPSNPAAFDGDGLAEWAERVFPPFQGDVTPAVMAGEAVLDCSFEASSLGEAVRSVLDFMRGEGQEPGRVVFEQREPLQAA